jgi:hypothetical protein
MRLWKCTWLVSSTISIAQLTLAATSSHVCCQRQKVQPPLSEQWQHKIDQDRFLYWNGSCQRSPILVLIWQTFEIKKWEKFEQRNVTHLDGCDAVWEEWMHQMHHSNYLWKGRKIICEKKEKLFVTRRKGKVDLLTYNHQCPALANQTFNSLLSFKMCSNNKHGFNPDMCLMYVVHSVTVLDDDQHELSELSSLLLYIWRH